MNKKDVIAKIQEHLATELQTIQKAANAAREEAVHEESRPEDEHDTRAIEAGYLAGAAAKRAEEIQGQILMYRFLPVRELSSTDVICAAALVELEHNGRRAFYFVVPSGGGLVTNIDGKPVQVITPASPMGEALMGHHVGDVIEVESRGAVREYKVISIR